MFYQCKMGQNTLEDVVDKFNIRELIEFERYCRDYKLWDEMRPLYHDDAKIVVLNRKAGSGTRATFEAAVFGDEAVDFKGDAELDKSGDVQTQMGSTDNAISYLDFSHFDDSKFNAIKVEGVEPKSKNVTDDSFKIWATEHMYCSKDADEATKAFLEFMLSDDVQGKLVEEQGFIPVSAMKVVKDASGKVSAK